MKPELPALHRSGHHASTILYEAPHKPSNPIEIPTQQRHILSPTFTPINRPLSPELIFEMSPVNSSSTESFFPSDYNPHYYPFVHRSLKNRNTTSTPTSKSPPFMYPFPRPPPHHKRQVKSDRLAPPQSPKSFPSSPLPLSCSLNRNHLFQEKHSIEHAPPQYCCLTSAFESDLETPISEYQPQACSFSPPASSRGRTRRRSSMSSQVSALNSPVSIHTRPRGRGLISRGQISPPPLLLQGNRRRLVLEDTLLKDVEPTLRAKVHPFDIGFGKHIMRRTEDEKRVKMGRSKFVSSVQGSFGT